MATGSLLTKIHKAYQEFTKLGLVDDHALLRPRRAGHRLLARSRDAMKRGTDIVKPVPKPKTIAKSLAIGTPADGYYAIHAMKETGGTAEDATDDEVVEGIKLLAEYEGIFAETAGGVTVACAKKLIEKRQDPARRRASCSASPATASRRRKPCTGKMRRTAPHQAQPPRIRGACGRQ